MPPEWGVTLYLKDESQRPTGSLKHGLLRRLFEQALASGWIGGSTTVVEATAGNAAVAGAYFAALLGVPFDPPLAVYDVTEACGSVPRWIVVGAGTGATSATLGRHLRYHAHPAGLVVVDPENSAYLRGWSTGYRGYATGAPSRIEGIGRPRIEPAFLPNVIDAMIPVPDAASAAAMLHLYAATGWRKYRYGSVSRRAPAQPGPDAARRLSGIAVTRAVVRTTEVFHRPEAGGTLPW